MLTYAVSTSKFLKAFQCIFLPIPFYTICEEYSSGLTYVYILVQVYYYIYNMYVIGTENILKAILV